MRYEGANTRIGQSNKSGSYFKSKVVICVLILFVLGAIKLYPADKFVKVKRAVSLILTKSTDIREEVDKLKNIFIAEDEVTAMNPVSEFINPATNGEIVKGFGVQDADNSGFHYGVDLKIEKDKNIVCAATGEITEIATNSEYGTYIVIKHNDEIFTVYAKLNEILPNVGDRIEKGQAIARVNGEDNTLHFEIRRGDTYLDPTEFIDFGETK